MGESFFSLIGPGDTYQICHLIPTCGDLDAGACATVPTAADVFSMINPAKMNTRCSDLKEFATFPTEDCKDFCCIETCKIPAPGSDLRRRTEGMKAASDTVYWKGVLEGDLRPSATGVQLNEVQSCAPGWGPATRPLFSCPESGAEITMDGCGQEINLADPPACQCSHGGGARQNVDGEFTCPVYLLEYCVDCNVDNFVGPVEFPTSGTNKYQHERHPNTSVP